MLVSLTLTLLITGAGSVVVVVGVGAADGEVVDGAAVEVEELEEDDFLVEPELVEAGLPAGEDGLEAAGAGVGVGAGATGTAFTV